MEQNIERSMVRDRIGHEVISGLENTLAWIRTQFDAMRSDVEIPKEKVLAAHSSEYLN